MPLVLPEPLSFSLPLDPRSDYGKFVQVLEMPSANQSAPAAARNGDDEQRGPMRGVRNTEDGIQVLDLPAPEPTGDQVRVRVAAAGICGSDLHLLSWGPMPTTLGHEIAVLTRLSVVAIGILGGLEDLAHDHGAVRTSVLEDLAGRCLQRLAHDLDADLLVVVIGFDRVEDLDGA